MEDLGGHRIEEGLGKLGLVVVGEQADVMQLDLLPHVGAEGTGLELGLQPLGRLLDTTVVELDAITLRLALTEPVGRLEARLGGGAGFSKQPVVAVEPIEHGLRDVVGAHVVERRRKAHTLRHGCTPLAAGALGRLSRSAASAPW